MSFVLDLQKGIECFRCIRSETYGDVETHKCKDGTKGNENYKVSVVEETTRSSLGFFDGGIPYT